LKKKKDRHCIGVDNGVAGAAAAALINWLVVVIQKMTGFSYHDTFFFALMNAI